jgi:hypothetical protein
MHYLDQGVEYVIYGIKEPYAHRTIQLSIIRYDYMKHQKS